MSPVLRRKDSAPRPPRSVRVALVRGVAWNAAFQAFATVVQLVRGVLVAALLAPQDYGLWGGVLAVIGAAGLLKQIGILEAYLADDDEDAERSLRTAYTLELGINAVLTVAIVVAAPLMALAYDDVEMLWLILVTALSAPAVVLQAGMWPLIKDMRFGELRLLQTIEPLLGTAITVALAIAGAGAWSLVVGAVIGAWATGLLALRVCPFPLRRVRDTSRLRSRLRVSLPVAAATASAAAVVLASIVVAELVLGRAAVGAIALASTIALAAQRLDSAIGDAVLPAISIKRETTALLGEAFGKANRMSLLWAGPIGALCAMFPETLVHTVLGDKWEPMIPVLRWFGVAVVLGHVGINLWQFLLVRGESRAILVLAATNVVAFCTVTVPLMVVDGVEGYGQGLAGAALLTLLVRGVLARRLFPEWSLVRHTSRALAPTLIAVAVTFAALAAGAPDGVGIAVLATMVVVAVATFERRLAHEAYRYLRGRGPVVPT